jgi:hypothetical protein
MPVRDEGGSGGRERGKERVRESMFCAYRDVRSEEKSRDRCSKPDQE